MADRNFFDQFDEAPQQPTADADWSAAPSERGNFFDKFDPGALSTNNVVRSVARGVPVLGGALNKANAATSALIDPILPDFVVSAIGGKRIPGKNFSERYESELAAQDALDAAFKEQHPIVSGTAEFAGAVGGTIPAMIAAPAAFGVGTAPIALRAAASAGSGGIIAGADGAVRTGDFNEAWKSGAVGLGLGAASPYLGAGAGKVGGKMMDLWNTHVAQRRMQLPPSVSAPAADMLAQDLQAAGGARAIQSRMSELGSDAMLLDASPSFLGRAQGLATQPETREAVMKPVMQRHTTANGRLRADLDEAIGPAPTPSRVESGLAQGREALGPDYERVFEGARAVDTTRLAQTLDAMAVDLRGDPRRSAIEVRRMLDIPGQAGTLDPSPRALFNTRQAIDGLLETEKDSKVLAHLLFARQAVDDYLRGAVSGLKQVDARFQELSRQSEGLRRGGQVLDGGKTALRPVEMADEIAAGVQPEGMLIGPSGTSFRIRQGARAEIDRQVGTKANDRVALRDVIKGDGDWNRDKLAQVFGDDQAARIIGSVDREAAFNDAYQKIVENSQTQMRSEAAAAVRPRPAGEGPGSLNDVGTALSAVAGGAPGALLNLGGRGVRFSANQIARASELARNGELAKVLTTVKGAELDLLVKTLENRIGIKAAGEAASDRAEYLTQLLLHAQGSRGSTNLPESLR